VDDPEAALFTALTTSYSGDSGAGGLSASGNAQVLDFVRRGEANEGRDLRQWQRIEVEIMASEDRGMAAQNAEKVVRFHIFTKRDAGHTREDAISGRLHTLFDGTEVSSLGATWTWGPMVWLRTFRGPSTGTTLHKVQEYRVRGQWT